MTLITSRRSLITGLASLIAAPAIVRVQNIMPVKAIAPARSVLTLETIKACVAWLRACDEARQEIERMCGVPEGYRLLVVDRQFETAIRT